MFTETVTAALATYISSLLSWKRAETTALAIIPPSTTATAEHAIGENCIIRKAIIDEYTSIGNNVQLINKDRHENYDGDGVYVRDGIIIVTTGTHLPDNFIF